MFGYEDVKPDPDFSNIYTVANKYFGERASITIAYLKSHHGYKFYKYHSHPVDGIIPG